MRRLGLTLLAFLLSSVGFAAEPNWVPVAEATDKTLVVYVDTGSVKVRDGQLTAWMKFNYSSPQKPVRSAARSKYRSVITLESFDCASERSGWVSVTYYSAIDGTGGYVGSASNDTHALEYLPPDTVIRATLEAVCQSASHYGFGSTFTANSGQTNAPSVSNQAQYTSDNHYTNIDGNVVHGPSYTNTGAPPPDATAQCADGTYSSSQHHQGTCSHHGGVAYWIN